MPKPRMIFAPGTVFRVVAPEHYYPDFHGQVGVIIYCPSPDSKVFVARIAPKPWTWEDDTGSLCLEERPEVEVVFPTCESEFMMIDQEAANVSP